MAGATLFVPRMGDVYGRRKPFLISSLSSIIAHLGLILSTNINLSVTLFFFLGLAAPGKVNIAYVYLLELVPTDKQILVATILQIAFGSTMILLAIYFRFISTHWLGF